MIASIFFIHLSPASLMSLAPKSKFDPAEEPMGLIAFAAKMFHG
jgi:hypothetical protein